MVMTAPGSFKLTAGEDFLTEYQFNSKEARHYFCKVCGICVALCPQDVFDSDGRDVPIVARLEACTACRFCELHCPDFAIEVEAAPAPAEAEAAEVDAGHAAVPEPDKGTS